MNNTLLIWDNNKSYLENTLSLELGISYPDDCVFSFEELMENKLVSAKDAVIVLLETDLDGKRRSNRFGLEIVKYLRKELRYKGLIIVYSTLTELYIRENVKESKILFTSGIRIKKFESTDSINADEIEELINSVPQLSDDLLDDIRYNVFDNQGKVHELLHNLKNSLSNIERTSSLENFIARANIILQEYKGHFLKEIDPFKIVEFEKVYTLLTKEINEDITYYWNNEKENSTFSYANAGSQVNKFSNQIVELAPVSNDNLNQDQNEKFNWQVLCFDDTEGVREKIKAFFEGKNVTCHTAATEEEVYQILKDNSPNISLFISDIRLLDNTERWCDRQGYDVIEQVNKTNDYPLVYTVLTSKKGIINKMVQKKRKYEILWFTKDDVINNEHSFNIFYDLIKDYAEDNFNSNTVFQPTYSAWVKPSTGFYTQPLKAYYKIHREVNHEVEDTNINKMTREWIWDTATKKDWTGKLLNDIIDDESLKKFRETKLLGRRVALGLALFSLSGKEIYIRMTGDNNNDGEKKFEGRKKQFYTRLTLPNNPEKLIDEAKEYFKGERSSIAIIFEEYEFLKNEFIEELFIDSINLGYERDGFYDFIRQIEKAFSSTNMDEPKSFEIVKSILDNEGFPRAGRLDKMFADLGKINEHSQYKLLKEVGKHSFLSSVNNEVIKELLKKYEYI